MIQKPCKRLWEAEALADGRLTAEEREAYLRHRAACASCRQGADALAGLEQALRALPEPPAPSELEHRRARNALLERAAHGGAGREEAPAAKRSRRAVAALIVAVAAGALLVVGGRSIRRPTPVNVGISPAFDVANVDHAEFQEERAGALSRVVLRAGRASFHVEHVAPNARFVVALPDGEVEVRGTRFEVQVTGGVTREVTVAEGVVAVRIAGFDGTLRAGEHWSRGELAIGQPSPATVPPPLATPPAADSPTATPPPAPPATTGLRDAGGPAIAHDADGRGGRFAAAMAAFNGGDYEGADRLFGRFSQDFPSDTRTEDAMYLQADARARRGDAAGARRAAQAYLARYPNGLRAPAAQRLASE